jgi:L-alanine-DL-glutamate epimerase-like enolase superfamily enzyme
MKIAKVEPILIAVPYEHGGPKQPRLNGTWKRMETLFVRVATDDGIVGWGEAYGFAASPVTATALERVVGPLCVGREIGDDIAAFMRDLQRALHGMGRSGPVFYALAGIDIALWDIAGKVAGKPLHRLLGGSALERLPTYASLLHYGSPDLVAHHLEKALGEGYAHIKLHERTVATVQAARSAGGANVPLMLDVNCAWLPDEARQMAHALEPYGLFWLEEPLFPPDDAAAMAALRRETRIPIAAGENIGSAGQMTRFMQAGAVDIAQPSVTKIGGIVEMRAAIAAARAQGVRPMPHSPYFGPGFIAALHVIAADAGGDMLCERFYLELEASPYHDAILAENGYMRVPQGSGLGVEPDMKVIERYRVG